VGLIAILVDGEQGAGVHGVAFDHRNLVSGVYFNQVEAVAFVESKKLMILQQTPASHREKELRQRSSGLSLFRTERANAGNVSRHLQT
jgi:hypothetical protein